jgi:PPK2 family polyphosphate:nucleotide phosphotransferase
MSKLAKELIVKPGRDIKLSEIDPGSAPGVRDKEEAVQQLQKNLERLAVLQLLLYAEDKRAVLVILQGIDASGKDGTIRHVMTGLNPQGCHVTPFKVPNSEELSHDFLWRIHKKVPSKGEIGVFNRSHYEDVLVARVHKLVPKDIWSARYEQINNFEKILSENNVTILKFFLYISKDEQKKRFEQRLVNPEKNWKFSVADLEDRKYWDDYMSAYEDAINRCSTPHAPWYIIPANKKWFRNLAVSQVMLETMEDMKMAFPKPPLDPSTLEVK